MNGYDVPIGGGGLARQIAALALGRRRRHVLVLDSNEPRNARTNASHNFFTRDGGHPLELRRLMMVNEVRVTQSISSISAIEHATGRFR